jgi:protein-S-isoprenylcysteine O-methyltransferase Ste14
MYEHEGRLDPRRAAQLLDETHRRAQGELDFRAPWLSLVAAAVVLLGFGTVWLSVRGQHPYQGPTAVSLVVLYALVVIRIGTVLYAHRRAQAGVSGRSVRERRAETAALGASLLAVYALMVALAHDGADDPAFYWVYGVTATLIVLGAFWAARSAVREDWRGFAISIAVMLVAAGSALAGPRGMWLADGVGLCVVLLVYTAGQVRPLRAGT